MQKINLRQSGITLIEVAIAVSIVSVMVVVVGFSVMTYVDARSQLIDDMKSLYLVEEGYEMLRILRDENWNTLDALTLDSIYYFDVSTTTIATSVTPEVIDGTHLRTFVLSEAYRDADDDLTDVSDPSATIDPDTLIATISVGGSNGTTSLVAVLTNLFAI